MTQIEQGFELKIKVRELSELILSRHPRMPVLLQDIHKTLRQYPEQMTLLEEADINTIVSGLMKQSNTEFATAAAKPAAAKNLKAQIKDLGLDAF